MEGERGVLVEDLAARVEKRLREFRQLPAQQIDAVAREVQHLPVKHLGIAVLLSKPRLKVLI